MTVVGAPPISAACQSVRLGCDNTAHERWWGPPNLCAKLREYRLITILGRSSRPRSVRKMSASNHPSIVDKFKPCHADLGGLKQPNPERGKLFRRSFELSAGGGIECLAAETRMLAIAWIREAGRREEAVGKSRKLAPRPSAALDNPAAAVS